LESLSYDPTCSTLEKTMLEAPRKVPTVYLAQILADYTGCEDVNRRGGYNQIPH
jgi:hypothetical protein